MSLTPTTAPAPAPTAVPSVTPASLLAAVWDAVPLPVLLEAADAELVEATLPGDGVFGYAVERRDGHVVLTMPAGRSDWERDTVARDLLARMRRVPLPGQRETVLAGV